MKTVANAAYASFALIASAAAQNATDIPDLAQALLEAAYATEDPAEIAAVARAVKQVFPDYEAAIAEQAEMRVAKLQSEEMVDEADATPVAPHGFFAVSPWDGKVQLSGAYSSGNSDNAAAGIAIDAARTAGDFVHNFNLFFDLSRSEGVTSQQRWGGAYQLDYALSERTYAYGRTSYEQDEFSGFDYRVFVGAGLGHFLFKSSPFTWKVEGGPGYRYSPIDLTDEVERELALYAASETDWIIRDGVRLEQDFNTTWTDVTTTFQSITALSTALTDSISTAVSFEYRFETDPPEGRTDTDTIARASLNYGF